jgi:hypothetical protein
MGKDTARVLAIVFDRLYVLRNQLVHGGATWNSGVNRQQVKDGAAILGTLLPLLLDLMITHPGQDHGEILGFLEYGVESGPRATYRPK